jgi:hypothetical protein
MAPEQAMVGRSVDGRADLYSLGCTLFKLLTGRAPYGGAEYDNAAKVMHAQCNVPISAADGFASIPDKLGDVISKLTAKDPAQRYATGNEVAEALAPFFATSAKDALQPHPLEQGREEIHETPVRPLTDPLPEELTRLTASVHETPRDTLSKPSASVKPETTPSRARLALLIGSAVFLVALVITYFAVAPFREPLGEKKDPEKKTDLVTGDKKTEPPEVKKLPELMEVVLPVASDAVRNIDTLKAKEWHDLLNEPKLPPMLIGLRKGDVNASARWFPTQARLVVNPTSLVLTQLGVTNKDFSLRTTMLQQNWHGQVGLYWGYRENNIALKKKKAGDTIASFQMLRLAERREQIKLGDTKTSVKKFFVERCKVELMFDHLGQITLKSHSNLEYCDLLNFANEQIFSMEVRGGELSNAVFGQTTLTKRLCANSINKKFQPFDYQGGFGIYSFDTNFTVRNASVMLLE